MRFGAWLGISCRDCLRSSVNRVKGAKLLPKKQMRREVTIFRLENAQLVAIQLIKLFEPEKCGSPWGTAVLTC
jgi:hypothetical protein